MRWTEPRWWALLVVVIFLVVVACTTSPATDSRGDGERMQLGTLMHLWYGFDPVTGECRGLPGSSHWDATVQAEPFLGFYCSDEPEVVEKQLQQMRRVGVNWVLLSWWGPGRTDFVEGVDNPIFQANQRALKLVLEQLKYLSQPSLGNTVKAAILVEPWPSPGADSLPLLELSAREKRRIWKYIYDELYEPYQDVWFQWDGKPLVVAYMPMDIGRDGRFTYRRMAVGEPPHIPTSFPMDWNVLDTQDPEVFAEIVSFDGFKKVSPRFNTFPLFMAGERSEVIQMDPLLEEGWYDDQWKWLKENEDRISLPFIWTWSEYHEQNFVEPTVTQPPVGSGTLLVDKSRHYWNLVKGGRPYKRYGE